MDKEQSENRLDNIVSQEHIRRILRGEIHPILSWEDRRGWQTHYDLFSVRRQNKGFLQLHIKHQITEEYRNPQNWLADEKGRRYWYSVCGRYSVQKRGERNGVGWRSQRELICRSKSW